VRAAALRVRVQRRLRAVAMLMRVRAAAAQLCYACGAVRAPVERGYLRATAMLTSPHRHHADYATPSYARLMPDATLRRAALLPLLPMFAAAMMP